MVVKPAVAHSPKLELPAIVHLTTVFGLRHPYLSVLLILLEMAGASAVLYYTGRLSVTVIGACVAACGTCLLISVHTGLCIWNSGLLDDLVDYVGEGNSRPCLTHANREAIACVVPAAVTGLIPLLFSHMEIGEEMMESMGEVEVTMLWITIAFTTADGPFLSMAVVTGPLILTRLVSGLLKCSVLRHFELLEAAINCEEGLSPDELIERMDGHCKCVKSMFRKANDCITHQVFLFVVLGYLATLVMALEIVVSVREETHSVFMLLCLGGMCFVFCTVSTMMLHSMTTVADSYEDRAADLGYDLSLRFKVTNTFPGPAGVKLLTLLESEHVNDISFNFHHRPLDARTLEATLIKLFIGAVTTVVLGIVT